MTAKILQTNDFTIGALFVKETLIGHEISIDFFCLLGLFDVLVALCPSQALLLHFGLEQFAISTRSEPIGTIYR